MDTSQVVFTTIASSVGALFSAFFGAKIAIKKYQKEKSFDERLKWHKDLGVTTKKLGNRLNAFRYFLAKNNKKALDMKKIEEMYELSFEFQELAELSSMYASTNTHGEIVKVVSLMNGLKQLFEKDSDNINDENHPLNLSLDGIYLIHDLVARDMRVMMGIGKIPENDRLQNM